MLMLLLMLMLESHVVRTCHKVTVAKEGLISALNWTVVKVWRSMHHELGVRGLLGTFRCGKNVFWDRRFIFCSCSCSCSCSCACACACLPATSIKVCRSCAIPPLPFPWLQVLLGLYLGRCKNKRIVVLLFLLNRLRPLFGSCLGASCGCTCLTFTAYLATRSASSSTRCPPPHLKVRHLRRRCADSRTTGTTTTSFSGLPPPLGLFHKQV